MESQIYSLLTDKKEFERPQTLTAECMNVLAFVELLQNNTVGAKVDGGPIDELRAAALRRLTRLVESDEYWSRPRIVE